MAKRLLSVLSVFVYLLVLCMPLTLQYTQKAEAFTDDVKVDATYTAPTTIKVNSVSLGYTAGGAKYDRAFLTGDYVSKGKGYGGDTFLVESNDCNRGNNKCFWQGDFFDSLSSKYNWGDKNSWTRFERVTGNPSCISLLYVKPGDTNHALFFMNPADSNKSSSNNTCASMAFTQDVEIGQQAGVIEIKGTGTIEAKWVDIAHIKYGDDWYVDENPYDPVSEYQNTKDKGDCARTIRANKAYGSNTTGTFFNNQFSQADNSCINDDHGGPITLKDDPRSLIGAYRDGDTMYVVAALKCTDSTEKLGVTYRKWDPNDPKYNELEDWRKGDSFYFKPISDTQLQKDQFMQDLGNNEAKITNHDCGVPGSSDSVQGFKIDGNGLPSYAKDGSDGKSGKPGGGPANSLVTPTCESQNNVLLAWLLCGIVNAADNGVQSLANIAENMLDINAEKLQGNDQLKAIWSYFRAISTFLLLGVGVVMVISQAVGKE